MTDDIRWETDADGILTLTLDQTGSTANTLGKRFSAAVAAAVERIVAEKDSLTGVVITSAKKTFVAGADLNEIRAYSGETVGDLATLLDSGKADFRRLETLGIPVVAALNGSALGGGLELALACHHRVALDAPGIEFGLPEVQLGLLPAGGGVVRTVRMFGLQTALLSFLLQGQKYKSVKAKEIGLVDELAATPAELIFKAKVWIRANPDARQPWDRGGFNIPGGTPASPSFASTVLPALAPTVRAQLKGQPMPAPRAILAAAVEGSQVDIENAFKIETRYVTELVVGAVSKNMINTLFFELNSIKKGASRPEGYPVATFGKAAVLGAGMMGAGIAYEQALAGMQVVLKDVTLEAAARGKGYSQQLLDKAVSRGTLTQQKRDEILARITPTDSNDDLADADIVVEAVFEDPAVKRQVFADVEKLVKPDALLASNTSTLPITDLATGVGRQEDFIGLHFFSPVDKMPLVEIIVGEKTSDAALAKAIDHVLAMNKSPIVVNDSRGFFTSRVFGRFLDEALAMLREGVAPSSIEQAGVQAGYPAPPLQLIDELTLTLPLKIHRSMSEAAAAEGRRDDTVVAAGVLADMVETHGRHGRSAGAGFYDYADGKRGKLWRGLREAFKSGTIELPMADMQDRMMFLQAIDTVHCLDEGVLRSVPDANVGAMFSMGYPSWSGGPIQFIKQYEGGIAGFVARAKELAQRYGDRFAPPESLTSGTMPWDR